MKKDEARARKNDSQKKYEKKTGYAAQLKYGREKNKTLHNQRHDEHGARYNPKAGQRGKQERIYQSSNPSGHSEIKMILGSLQRA